MQRRHTCAAIALAAIAATTAGASWAQGGSYPSAPITMVVPFAAGSGTDAVARAVGLELGKRLKQPVIVDNRAGANAQIAAGIVAKAKPDGYTFGVSITGPMARIFTPTREIAFAGHPSIGSAHVALLSGFANPRGDALIQECQAGLLPIRIEGDSAERRLFIQSPKATVIKTGIEPGSLLESTLGKVRLGKLPPAFVEGGRRWWLAEFADAAALRAWHPDHASIRKIALDSDSLGLCAFARSAEPGHDLVLRAFPAGVGIVEDPASGAANGLVAAYIAHAEPDGPLSRGYTVSQGREIGHDAELILRIDADATVWVGGQTQTVVSGEVEWPHSL